MRARWERSGVRASVYGILEATGSNGPGEKQGRDRQSHGWYANDNVKVWTDNEGQIGSGTPKRERASGK